MRQKQKGVIPVIVVIILAVLVLGGGVAYYFGPAKKLKEEAKTQAGRVTEESAQPQISITEISQQEGKLPKSSTPTTADEFADWQEYKNEKYYYKIKYPADWYFIKEGYNPPPPVAVMFSNLSEGYQPNVHYASVGIDVMPAEGESLEENGEVKNLVEEQYYQKTRITVSGEPALKLETPDKSESHFSVYILYKDNFYRMVCGESGPEQPKYGETFQKILDSFTFTD